MEKLGERRRHVERKKQDYERQLRGALRSFFLSLDTITMVVTGSDVPHEEVQNFAMSAAFTESLQFIFPNPLI
jgi:hypothetical protein